MARCDAFRGDESCLVKNSKFYNLLAWDPLSIYVYVYINRNLKYGPWPKLSRSKYVGKYFFQRYVSYKNNFFMKKQRSSELNIFLKILFSYF